MEKFDLKVAKKYTKDGFEKTFWQTVGSKIIFTKKDGTKTEIVEIPAIGLKASVFPAYVKQEKQEYRQEVQKPKEQGPVPMPEGVDYPEEDINPDDIPF